VGLLPRATRFISAATLVGMGTPFIVNTVFFRNTCLCCDHAWSQLHTQGLRAWNTNERHDPR